MVVAVFLGRLKMVKLLLEEGGDATAIFEEGRHSLLHAAVYKNLPDILALLLREDAIDLNAVDAQGRTAVDYCAYYGRASCLEALLLDPRTDTTHYSSNALSYAVCRGHADCARLLLQLVGGLPLVAFYEQLLVPNSSNRRAILAAATMAGFPECFFALLRSDRKAAVDAERPSWRGISRRR